jgi:hypothetical protein
MVVGDLVAGVQKKTEDRPSPAGLFYRAGPPHARSTSVRPNLPHFGKNSSAAQDCGTIEALSCAATAEIRRPPKRSNSIRRSNAVERIIG